MYPPEVFRVTLVRLLDVFGRLGVRCHLTGGVTSVAYGEPRMTQDIDLVVAEALKVDVYSRELIPGELDRSVLLEVFEGVTIPCVSRPDAAASKLVWAALGSHESRRDLRRMHDAMPVADREKVRRLAEVLGHGVLLREILAEPDEISG